MNERNLIGGLLVAGVTVLGGGTVVTQVAATVKFAEPVEVEFKQPIVIHIEQPPEQPKFPKLRRLLGN